MRILIVDDERVSRMKLTAILEPLGECRSVESGLEAVAEVRQAIKAGTPFDLITLDVGMPDMDGTEVLFEIRNLEEPIKRVGMACAKIIMVTGQSDRDCLITCVQAGCDDYIVKPFDPVRIRERLKRLKLAPPCDEAPASGSEPAHAPGPAEAGKLAIGKEVMRRFKDGEISLPSPSGIYRKFSQMVAEGADLREVAELLKEDMGISFHLISVSNSPFYRGVRENKNLRDALERLGLDQTRKYVNVLCNRAVFATTGKAYQPLMEELWEHSLACAYAAEIMAKACRLTLTSDPFTLGLLHDVGKMVLIQVISELEARGELGFEVNRTDVLDTLEAFHEPFGEAVLKQWQFNGEFLLAARHHDSIEDAESPSKELIVVHLANLIAKQLRVDSEQPSEDDPALSVSAIMLHMDAERIAYVKEEMVRLLAETKSALSD